MSAAPDPFARWRARSGVASVATTAEGGGNGPNPQKSAFVAGVASVATESGDAGEGADAAGAPAGERESVATVATASQTSGNAPNPCVSAVVAAVATVATENGDTGEDAGAALAVEAAPGACAGFLLRAAEDAAAALAVPDQQLDRERAEVAEVLAAEAEGALHSLPEDQQQRVVAGIQAAALLRPPAWSDQTSLPPPGALCGCCRGQRWWAPSHPSLDGTGPGPGWRCLTCHPPPPGARTKLTDTSQTRRRPLLATRGQ